MITASSRPAAPSSYEGCGGGGIYQGLGRKGNTEIRLLFTLEARVSINPNLDFLSNVTRVVAERFEDRFAVRFDEAVRTAR